MVRELAYAKLNLVLHVGRRRDDGMHPVCTLVASIDLADEVVAEPKESGEDTVECEGVPGNNLAARALAEFRSRAGRELPPLAITIRKRVARSWSGSPPASVPMCPASSTRGTRSCRGRASGSSR